MTSKKDILSKFQWGDAVTLTDTAPEKYKTLTSGSICGINRIEDEKSAAQFEVPIGDFVYVVEEADGASVEVPERYLKKIG